MRPPRGLKKILKSSSPVKLTGKGKFKGFELLKHGKPTNIKLAGLTKRLDSQIFSNGALPAIATHGTERKIGWKGQRGGIKRGSAVDAQLTKCINSGKISPQKGHYSLTKLVLITLAEAKLVPVVAQRGCCSVKSRVATAADIVCYNPLNKCMVVVELKCGFSGSRTAPAIENGRPCTMKNVLEKAPDCVMNRHLAQLAATCYMLESETETLAKIATLGVNNECVEAKLLYANETSCDLINLPTWWKKKSKKLVDDLR